MGLENFFQAPKIVSPVPNSLIPSQQPNPLVSFLTNLVKAPQMTFAESTPYRINFNQNNSQNSQQLTPTPAVLGSSTTPTSQQNSYINSSQALPKGIDKAINFIKSQIPDGSSPENYYPALKDQAFMQKVQNADRVRPGLGNMLLLQGFFESTLGRSANNNNIFGVLPGGEGNQAASFNSPSDALNYQLSDNVMGGGALGKNSDMDLLSKNGQSLTVGDMNKFYQHYNPEGAYIKQMNSILTQ